VPVSVSAPEPPITVSMSVWTSSFSPASPSFCAPSIVAVTGCVRLAYVTMSVPAPPVKSSAPRPPSSVSLPASPSSESAPGPPVSTLAVV